MPLANRVTPLLIRQPWGFSLTPIKESDNPKRAFWRVKLTPPLASSWIGYIPKDKECPVRDRAGAIVSSHKRETRVGINTGFTAHTVIPTDKRKLIACQEGMAIRPSPLAEVQDTVQKADWNNQSWWDLCCSIVQLKTRLHNDGRSKEQWQLKVASFPPRAMPALRSAG
jgi:hypothetical protein